MWSEGAPGIGLGRSLRLGSSFMNWLPSAYLASLTDLSSAFSVSYINVFFWSSSQTWDFLSEVTVFLPPKQSTFCSPPQESLPRFQKEPGPHCSHGTLWSVKNLSKFELNKQCKIRCQCVFPFLGCITKGLQNMSALVINVLLMHWGHSLCVVNIN